MSSQFKPPKDPALRALWIIRNWTKTPIGNLTTYQDIVLRVHSLADEVFNELYLQNTTNGNIASTTSQTQKDAPQ